ncbi:hypothetical protein WA158_002198 [Blastocystis sp. Blastoise]
MDNMIEETDPVIQNLKIDVYILTCAGKPVYWNKGNEEDQSTEMGILQAIDSNFTSLKYNISMVKSSHQYIYFTKISSLIFVYVSKEPIDSIQHIYNQMKTLYSYILFNTTDMIIKHLDRDYSYDIRDAIGGIYTPMTNLLSYSHFHPSFIFNALPILRLAPNRKDMLKEVMTLLKGKDILCGLLCCKLNYVYQNTTIRQTEGWLPVCLPQLDSSAFVHIYTYFITENVYIIFITPKCEPQQFSILSNLKNDILVEFEKFKIIRAIEESNFVGSYTIKDIGIIPLCHFVYIQNKKYLTMPQIEGPYKDKNYQLQLWRTYQKVYSIMCSENISDYYENSGDLSSVTYESLKSLLVDDEIEVKIAAVKQLHLAAATMGKDETINTLLPALQDWTVENDDEALSNLASELPKFSSVFQGDEIKVVTPLLKSLCQVEEVAVRDKACESFILVIKELSPEAVLETVLPLVKSLADNEWFTSRVSVAQLIIPCYKSISSIQSPDCDEKKQMLREIFFSVCHDDVPMTRRAGAYVFTDAIEAFGVDYIDQMIELYIAFYDDDNDVICMISLSACSLLLKITRDPTKRENILSVFKNCLVNKSWKLRSKAAEESGPIVCQCEPAEIVKYILTPYTQLLKDHENEVKTQAAKQVAVFYTHTPNAQFISDILPFLRPLSQDAYTPVREGLAESMMNIVKESENNDTVINQIKDIFQSISEDATPSVRLILVQNINKILSVPQLMTFIQPIIESDDNAWRIREQIILHMSDLVQHYGKEAFVKNILSIYIRSFTDNVNAVRVAGRTTLHDMLETLGVTWIYPLLCSIYESHHTYLVKSNILYAYSDIYRHATEVNFQNELMNHFLLALDDPTPNVKFITCKIFIDIHQLIPETQARTEILPRLHTLVDNNDIDVKFYANLALEAFN